MRSAVNPVHAPTKEEHDAVVAARGRNYTDSPMRRVERFNDEMPTELSPLDQHIANLKGNR